MVECAVLHRERAASQNAEVPSGIAIYSHKNDLMSSLEMLQNWTKYLSAHSLRFSLLISHTCIRALEAASVDSVKNVWTLHTATQTLFCCLCHSYRDRKLLLDFKQAFPRYLHTTFPTLSPCWPSAFFSRSHLSFSRLLSFSLPFHAYWRRLSTQREGTLTRETRVGSCSPFSSVPRLFWMC